MSPPIQIFFPYTTLLRSEWMCATQFLNTQNPFTELFCLCKSRWISGVATNASCQAISKVRNIGADVRYTIFEDPEPDMELFVLFKCRLVLYITTIATCQA